jgi:hypothetical protein
MFDSRSITGQDTDFSDFGARLNPRGLRPDDLLTREQVAAALTAMGYLIREKTLATKASRGGGPSYNVFNRRALYRWADALAWAKAQMRTSNPPNQLHHEEAGQ